MNSFPQVIIENTNEMNNTVNGVKKANPNPEDDELDDSDYLCGLGNWKPRSLQIFACKEAYLVSYCALSLCQGMFYTYIVSVLTTIEKRFAVSSKVSGLIITGNEFSQIFGALFVGFYGGRGHRPRWIAVGMYISALSCFIMATPEFIFPDNQTVFDPNSANTLRVDVCQKNSTEDPWCVRQRGSSSSIAAMVILFLGLFVSGLGTLALHSLGFPYMDDNVSKKKISFILGISFGLRIIGPALGFLLGGMVLNYYHDFSKIPEIGPEDPRWVGAWWIGFVIIGKCLIITSTFMLLFPRELPRNRKQKLDDLNGAAQSIPVKKAPTRSKQLPPFKELPSAVKRLIKNPIIMAHTVEAVFYLLGAVGFATFFPKYLESQFRQTASRANIIAAGAGLGVMVVGYIISGAVVQYYRFRPRVLAGYGIITSLIHIGSMIIGMFLTCQETIPVAGTLTANGNLDLIDSCNVGCSCTTSKYSPVCDLSTNQTYFSACHLGCTSYNESSKFYSNCSCSEESIISDIPLVKEGKCSIICQAFMFYIILKTVTRFIGSTDRVGMTIILFRAVEPRDKSLMFAWFNAVLCLFAFMPCTIVYGAIVDKTCLVWEESCGERGNCWVYDPEKMRLWLHGFTIILLVLSILSQFVIWYKCKNIKLYEDEQEENFPTSEEKNSIELSEFSPEEKSVKFQ